MSQQTSFLHPGTRDFSALQRTSLPLVFPRNQTPYATVPTSLQLPGAISELTLPTVSYAPQYLQEAVPPEVSPHQILNHQSIGYLTYPMMPITIHENLYTSYQISAHVPQLQESVDSMRIPPSSRSSTGEATTHAQTHTLERLPVTSDEIVDKSIVPVPGAKPRKWGCTYPGCRDNKTWFNKEDVRCHVRKHLRQGQACICLGCNKTFSSMKIGRRHQRDKESQYRCNKCNRQFTRAYSRNKHAKSCRLAAPDGQ